MNIADLMSQDLDRGSEKIFGVVIGIVTNNQDPEGLGRVKVKFPWRESQDESDWARLTTLMAGNERGSFFLPEVDDEVLVAFGQGNLEQPYVIGTLWNGKDKPPETNSDGNNNIRKLKSRSGHEIIFNDDSQQKKEKLELRTKAGHSLVLDDSSGQEKIEIKDKTGSNSIILDSAQNSITIECAGQLKIKAQMIELEAGASMTLKSNGSLTIKGTIVQIN